MTEEIHKRLDKIRQDINELQWYINYVEGDGLIAADDTKLLNITIEFHNPRAGVSFETVRIPAKFIKIKFHHNLKDLKLTLSRMKLIYKNYI